jgi:hypothetical protein
MKFILALMVGGAALGAMPAAAGDSDVSQNVAFLQSSVTVGLASPDRADSERNAALIKEGESESPDTVALIERNREDRERSVVMDR